MNLLRYLIRLYFNTAMVFIGSPEPVHSKVAMSAISTGTRSRNGIH